MDVLSKRLYPGTDGILTMQDAYCQGINEQGKMENNDLGYCGNPYFIR